MPDLRAFLSLPLGDKVRLSLSVFLLLFIWGGVVVMSFNRFRKLLLKIGKAGSSVIPGSPSPGRVARSVDFADRSLPGDRTCLVRSLTAETLLRMYGYVPKHRIGVDKNEKGAVEAHSWIEYNGAILIGDLEDLSRFKPLPSLDEVGHL
ncbi:lasso peptide biosynthesis B2 protein [Halorientalis persicus]|uniref:lasso peptide biosynthesis B2 protein n=1 Tax=Halorientalis persicus TaxID=1367881 RepID=UPI000B8A2006|nr:lasso peptide biosynthesis B2 protein [Halorientalis persicus]